MITAAGVPTWVADLALPVGFGLIAAAPRAGAPRRIGTGRAHRGARHRRRPPAQPVPRRCSRTSRCSPWLASSSSSPASLGAPIFALLGGIALFASLTSGNPPVVLPMMAYQELTTSTGIAAIPLFTLAGFLLAEGKSSERLLRVFRALGRLGAGRHGGRRGDAVRVLHALHRRLGRHDSRAGRTAAAGARSATAIASGFRSAC